MSKGLLDYEKSHNAFIRELSLSLKRFASSLTPDEHLLIVPQNVAIEQLIISRDFAEAHATRLNLNAPFQCVSLDGKRRIMISEDRHLLYVLPGTPGDFDPDASDLSPFWRQEGPTFDMEKQNVARNTTRAETYVILREGSVDLGIFGGQGPIPVVLLSHPLKPTENTVWPTHPSTLGFDNSLSDPFLAMSPMQSSSPREVYAESEDEAIDRIQGVFSSASSPSRKGGAVASAPLLAQAQKPQTLDWIFELGAVGAVNANNRNSGISNVTPNATPASVTAVSKAALGSSASASTGSLLSSRPSSTAAGERKAQERQEKMEKEKQEREQRERHKAAFFEKMKHRRASDLVQGVKGFVTQFLDKPPSDPERQAEVVRNFLQVLEEKIRNHTVWASASEDELDEMSETLERFVVSKIYRVIFAPSPPDLVRDEELKQKITRLSVWLEPRHLDINLDTTSRRTIRVLGLAVEQLRKWNTYKAPRDKMVCILNACKAVWKLLENKKDGKPAGADDFLPHLIWTVISANPPNLYSNVEYISRYRHPAKMAQEFGYYFTQLASVVPFLEGLNSKILTGVSESDYKRAMSSGVRPPPPQIRSVSSMALLETASSSDLADSKPLVPKAPLPSLQRSNTVSGAIAIPVSALESTKSSDSAAVVSSSSQYRFVGRSVESLTIAEVAELLAQYQTMAQTLSK